MSISEIFFITYMAAMLFFVGFAGGYWFHKHVIKD